MICFFFSSRRRHTRYWRDWSSDVCSSDLKDIIYATQKNAVLKLTGRAVKVDKRIQILVIPAFLSSQENMAHLPKNLNYGKIKSEYLGESCYIGQGAGKYPTAHAVVQDILSILEIGR